MQVLLPERLCSLAAWALLSSLSSPSAANDFTDLLDHVKRFGEHARMHNQVPLQPVKAQAALIFIGGYADELGGYFHKVSEAFPALPRVAKQVRAYYHWHGGNQSKPHLANERIAQDITAFRKHNPTSPVIIMGHSLGAARALEVTRLLQAGGAPLYLVTLDPVDRASPRTRPAHLNWWGNSYVVHSQSNRDFVHEMSGRWKESKGADVNLRFDGRQSDERGYPFIHDNAWSLLTSRVGDHELSLYDELIKAFLTPKAANKSSQ